MFPFVQVAAGTMIDYWPYVFGRSTALWGEDALEFKPTRWLDPTSHTGTMQVSPYKFITFNAGYVGHV